jgi:hypothetical protein
MAIRFHVAEITFHVERSSYELHGRNELVGGDVLQHLDVLARLASRLLRGSGGAVLAARHGGTGLRSSRNDGARQGYAQT